MIKTLLFIPLFLFLPLFGETLINSNFSDSELYKPLPAEHPEHITGSLPAGVIEDSDWAKVGIHYQHQKNPLGGDLGWLEVALKGGEKGQAQLKWELPPLETSAQYRLSFTAASPDNASLTLAIRDGGPPWKAHWEKTFRPAGYLQPLQADFTLPALGENKVLIAHMGQRGTFQIEKLSLIRRDEAELAKEREEKLSNAPDNLLSVTGFPLGLPPLWSTGNRYSRKLDIRIEPAESPSPRGTVPLRLATRTEGIHLDLYSAPFEPLVRSEPHTLSFFLKGNLRDGSVSVQVNKKALARTTLPPSPDVWTRVSLTFTPDPLALFHVMHWTLDGDIEIDGLMLNVGTEANPFTLQRQAEVVLSANRAKNHVIVDGIDSPVVQAAITGAPEDSVLELSGYSLGGERQVLKPVSLKGEAVEQLDISIADLFPDTPYGPFRIEAQVVSGDTALSPATDLVVYRLRKPRHWGTVVTTSPFGGHFHVHEPHLYSAKAIGQNWNRLHGDNGKWTYWSGVEPEKGKWTFHHDRMQAMKDAGFGIIGVWVHSPGWARVKRKDKNGWPDNWWQPENYEEFVNYTTRVTEAYKDTIQHWQIWNEPWGEFWFKEWRPELGSQHQWHAGPDPDGDYARLSAMTYEAVKKASPDTTVLGIHATIGDRGKKWMKQMLKLDAEKYTDDFSFHAYAGGRLSQLLGDDDHQLTGRIERYILDPMRQDPDVTRKPVIWLTEGNVLGSRSHSGGGLYRQSWILDPEPLPSLREESQLLSVYHLLCFSKGVDHVITYAQNAVESHFHEKNGLYWGALGLNGGELNTSAAVYAAMTWHLEGAKFQKRQEINGIHAFVFQRGDTAVAALIAPYSREDLWTPPENDALVWRDHLGNDTKGPFDFGTLVWVEQPGTAVELVESLTSEL